MCVDRRQAVRFLLLGVAAWSVLPADALAEITAERWLDLSSAHTGERLHSVYFDGRDYVPVELGMIDWLLRDHRTSEVLPIDKGLLDLLYELATTAGREPSYEIISAYRSPSTNAMLATTSDGVSSQSLHMEGRAIDVRLVGLPTAELRDLALARQAGGVGYYAKSDFVHLDVGRVRSWTG